MITYIINRTFKTFPIILGVISASFLLFHIVPGDPAISMVGENYKEETLQQIRKELNTDPLEGGIDMPDGGDGITRYPQDGTGGIIPPEEMPDYVDPEQDGVPSDDDKFGDKGEPQ